MAEFVKECLHFAQREQGWVLSGRLRKIHHHADVRSHILLGAYLAIVELAFLFNPLPLELSHPGSTLLALTWIEVGIEHSQIRAVAVEHLVGLHVGMIDGNVAILLECDAIQTIGQSEHAVDDLVELEVRTQHLGIEIIAFHLQLVGIESEVPRLHLLVVPEILGEEFLHLLHLLDGGGFVSVDEFMQQLVDVGRATCHAMHHHIVGEGVVAKQLG